MMLHPDEEVCSPGASETARLCAAGLQTTIKQVMGARTPVPSSPAETQRW